MLPTPAVALLALDLGVVVSASHNPPEYNGVKFFDRRRAEAHRRGRGGDRGACSTAAPARAAARSTAIGVAADSYVEHVLERFGSDLLRASRIGVDCANGAYSGIAPAAFERLGAEVAADRQRAATARTSTSAAAPPTSALLQAARSSSGRLDLGVAFDGDGDRMLAVDGDGGTVDGDQILAILALHLEVDLVAVTVMTNLGFHRLMEEHGIRVVTTDVGDRYVLEALRREGGILGGEQSGHLICLDGHVTGDGLAAALLLCRALEGRTLAEAAAVMPRYPQAKENVPVHDRELPRRPARGGRAAQSRSSTAGAASSCARRARSRSSACSRRPKTSRKRTPSVLASRLSFGESSARPTDEKGSLESRALSFSRGIAKRGANVQEVPGVRDHRIRRAASSQAAAPPGP